MNGNGQAVECWGFALQGQAPPMLQAALRSVLRTTAPPAPLPACNGDACHWVRAVADCLVRGECQRAVLFCDDAVGARDGDDTVSFDNLGAGFGSQVGFSEGAEAAAPFYPEKKPVDAYCAAILDQVTVTGPTG